jgi:hypothetical protein
MSSLVFERWLVRTSKTVQIMNIRQKLARVSVISSFRRDVEICTLLGCNAAWSANPLPTFPDNVSVPLSGVKKSKRKEEPARRNAVYTGEVVGVDSYLPLHNLRTALLALFSSWTSWSLNMGPMRCPKTSVKDYNSTLRNIPKQRRSH